MVRLMSWVLVAGLFACPVCRAGEGALIGEGVGGAPGAASAATEVPSGGLTDGVIVLDVDLPKSRERVEALSLQVYSDESDGAVYFRSPLQNAKAQRLALIQSLQALQDAYCRNAQLDEAIAIRDMIRQLEAQATTANSLHEPASRPSAVESLYAYDLRGLNGQTFYRRVTGTADGTVWGGGEENIYTDDSNLGTAAVHAGVLKVGETAMLRFTILPGQDSYVGSTRNDVTTRPYQSYGGSVRIDGAAPEIDSIYNLRGQDKPPFAVYVVGNLNGSVYGTGSYTDDSSIGTAAVHAGLLQPGEAGFVVVTLEGGKPSYEASTQNGVTSYSYGAWGGGYQLSAFRRVIPERR